MKTRILNWRYAAFLACLAGSSISTQAQTAQPVSALDGSQGASAVGGGDSGAPIISPDGRYVLFASTAGNLVLTSNNTATATPSIPTLNVFLRDRTNGTTVLISANLAGTGGGNGDSIPVALSTNAQYVVFESSASDLVPDDTNGVTDVFVRDLTQGTTVLVSVGTNGGVGNGASRSAGMTPDGRYVAFVSAASNLVAGDTNGIPDVFVRDLHAGITVLASPGATPLSLSSSSESPDITPDGRYVAFYSTATGLVGGVTSAQDIYVRDLTGGTTIWASADAKAAALAVNVSNIVCYNHAISADGKFVVYEASPTSSSSPIYPGLILRYGLDTGLTDLIYTNAAIEAATGGLDIRNLDMTPDGQRIVFVASTNGPSGATTCIMLWDAASGACSLVSGDRNGNVVTNANCDWPTIDPTGQFVAFNSSATNLTTNALAGACHLYLRDLNAGVTTLLDADTNGIGSFIGPLTVPCLSGNARFVAFECDDGNLVPNDRNRDSDVVVRDLTTGSVELVSTRQPTLPGETPNGWSMLSPNCASTDGRYVAFASDADNLVLNDTNGCRDVFVRDRLNGTNILVSVGTNGFAGDGISYEPAISADGRYVAFTSQADNLVAGDNNRTSDVFVRDRQTGVTTLVSVNALGSGPGNTNSSSPVIGSGGRYVMFRSRANNLTLSSVNNFENLFLRDLQAGTNVALTTSGWTNAAMTPDGHFVIFVGFGGPLKVWDTGLGRNIYTNNTSGINLAALTTDGNRIAYWTSSRLVATDLVAHSSWTIISNAPAVRPGLRFSADDRFLTYAAVVGSANQVYLYDFVAATNVLVSRAYNSTAPGNGFSDSPDISSDGRFVAYRSAASNLVPGDTNGVPDIFLFDRQNGATTLLSVSYFGSFAANNRSLSPVFTGDGQTLLFQTWASDVAGADFNQVSDVLAYSLYASGSIPVFSVAIFSGESPGQGPWLTWQAVPGRSYHVQFKTDLTDTWQELGADVTLVGNQGYCQDLAPSATRRFYRIVGQ